MEGEGIDNCRILVVEVDIDAFVGKLEIAATVVEEQKSTESVKFFKFEKKGNSNCKIRRKATEISTT